MSAIYVIGAVGPASFVEGIRRQEASELSFETQGLQNRFSIHTFVRTTGRQRMG